MNIIEDYTDGDYFTCSVESNVNPWVIDSGVSSHAMHNLELDEESEANEIMGVTRP